MASKSSLFIPQTVVWLTRLATQRALANSLLNNPVAFAAWYAGIGDIVDWPEEVTRIQQGERAKRLSLDRMIKLLTQVNHVFSGRTSAEHARRDLEGYAIHDWVTRHPNEFTALALEMQEKLSRLQILQLTSDEAVSPFAARITELAQALELSPLEQQILAFAFLTTVSDELRGLFEQLASDRWTARVLWTALFDTTADELAKALQPCSPLRLSGLLQMAERRVRLATVSTFWVDLLAGTDSLTDALLEQIDDKVGSGKPARLLEEDLALAIRLLRNAHEPGVNLLLYGNASLPFDENLLATNAVPAVWLGSDIANLPDDTIARFIFHAPLKKAERSAHEQAVKLRLKKLRLGKLATAKILALDGVSSAQIESAAKAARLAGSTTKSARDQALVQALVRSQRALSRDLADRTRPPVTQYSLEYLNTSGRFSPQQILASLRRRPKGSLLLYGPPGTGKTQFTEHLASELKLPLVNKSASALSANSLPPG